MGGEWPAGGHATRCVSHTSRGIPGMGGGGWPASGHATRRTPRAGGESPRMGSEWPAHGHAARSGYCAPLKEAQGWVACARPVAGGWQSGKNAFLLYEAPVASLAHN